MDVIEKRDKGLSGSTLKIIAIITMFIDHVGASIVQGELYYLHLNYEAMQIIFNIGMVMRLIGRLAFPIFCYLLVEGFKHTKSIKKYAIRLLIFALISEIPFDLAFYKTFFAWQHQNVFFTLFLGVLVMYGVDYFMKRFKDKKLISALLSFTVIAVGMIIAELINCDYASEGILIIVVLYLFYGKKNLGAILVSVILVAYCINPAIAMYKRLVLYGYNKTNLYVFVYYMLSSALEAFASLAFIPIHYYNGKRGLSTKYFFYIFYPAHLLLLGIIVNYIM